MIFYSLRNEYIIGDSIESGILLLGVIEGTKNGDYKRIPEKMIFDKVMIFFSRDLLERSEMKFHSLELLNSDGKSYFEV